MPFLAPRDTAAVLGSNAEKCDSRSLLLDKFSDPAPKADARKSFFDRFIRLRASYIKLDSWQTWLLDLNTANDPRLTLVYAQLRSRLIINGSGGVMENAGLCVDRFGIPYIPGSAVKACARRAAIHDLTEAGSTSDKAEVAYKLCLVFGWAGADWKPGRNKNGEPYSDMWLAMANHTERSSDPDTQRNTVWNEVARIVANRILDRLNVLKPEFQEEPWRNLPSFGGSVCFLQSYPLHLSTARFQRLTIQDIPPADKLELDVV
ncbi:MAG: hypothetical protein N3G20_09705, partial [Verrucomicrobiae bacterium]|nr:hypothetical protein [Verrucomicrobiae bacterium]